jgi:hypothetical protein
MTRNNYSIRLPPIDKSKEYSFKKLKKNIKNLPDELKRYIFDFLKYELWLNEFIDTINSVNCKSLEYNILRPFIPRSLAIPAFTNLCIQKIKYFQGTWEFCKRGKNKNFKKYTNGNDFAMTLLMCYYH